MPTFGSKSKQALATAHPQLQALFNRVIQTYDCTVLQGFRTKEAQDAAVRAGASKTPWPQSKHNRTPSHAVDVAPFPIDWNDLRRFYHFAGFVQGVARQMGISLRWGGDWDGDGDFKDNKFNDLVHFELVGAVDSPES